MAFGFIETRLTSPASENPTINIAGKDIRVGVSEQMTSLLKSLVPLGRTGTAKEAADAVYLLCIPESNYISGQTLVVGGGLEI